MTDMQTKLHFQKSKKFFQGHYWPFNWFALNLWLSRSTAFKPSETGYVHFHLFKLVIGTLWKNSQVHKLLWQLCRVLMFYSWNKCIIASTMITNRSKQQNFFGKHGFIGLIWKSQYELLSAMFKVKYFYRSLLEKTNNARRNSENSVASWTFCTILTSFRDHGKNKFLQTYRQKSTAKY